MRIKCPNCGSNINPNAKFCENCGTPIPKNDFHKKNKSKNNHSSKKHFNDLKSQDKVRCPECGLRQDPRVGRCKRCGTNLKHLPLEFPEDNYSNPNQEFNKRPKSSMPRPNINKTPKRETHPNSRFDEGYDDYYDSRNPNRFEDNYNDYQDTPRPSRGSGEYRISDGYLKQTYHCPSCGVRLPSRDTICPRCGYGQVTTVKSKNPILAALLSALVMGLGQLYTGKIIKGICLFAIEVICILTSWLIIPLFFGFSFYVYGIIDAYEVANKITERVY